MSDFEPGQVPVAGSLSARIIRKCPAHRDCPLTCKQRKVEDLGEIASFDLGTHEQIRNWRRKFVGWMTSFSQTQERNS